MNWGVPRWIIAVYPMLFTAFSYIGWLFILYRDRKGGTFTKHQCRFCYVKVPVLVGKSAGFAMSIWNNGLAFVVERVKKMRRLGD